MDWKHAERIRTQAAGRYVQIRNWLAQLPATARIMLGLFLVGAVLMALYTAVSGKDATLHLTLQHGFRSADVSLWVDGDLSYSGKLRGSAKKKFGLLPGAVHGSLSAIGPVSAGSHQIRVQVESEDGSTQQDTLTGDFSRNTERELSVSASPSGLSLAWLATRAPGPSSESGWLSRYAGSVILTIAGSIISALTGFALRELPAYLRERQNPAPKAQSTAAGQ